MGKKVYTKTALTGGADDALDSINGSLLNKGDIAIVSLEGTIYFYALDNDNRDDEASPDVIKPDGQYSGTKRWVLQSYGGGAIDTGGKWYCEGFMLASITAIKE